MPLGILSSRGRLRVYTWLACGELGGGWSQFRPQGSRRLYGDFGQAYRVMPLVMEEWAGQAYPWCKSFTTASLLKITQVHVPRTVVLLHNVIAYQSSCITLGKISPFVVSSTLESFSKYNERLADLQQEKDSSVGTHHLLRGAGTEFCETLKQGINLAQNSQVLEHRQETLSQLCQIKTHLQNVSVAIDTYIPCSFSNFLLTPNPETYPTQGRHGNARPSTASQIRHLKSPLSLFLK